MKAVFFLIAAMVFVPLFANLPDAMAGAYTTGEGDGYASGAGVTVLPSGIIFRVVQAPNSGQVLRCEIRQPQRILTIRYSLRPIAYYPEETKI